jgi:hypothetical protein
MTEDQIRQNSSGSNPAPGDAAANDWNTEEKKHHRIERRYWFASWILSVLIAAGAVGSAIFAYNAWREAHEQAVQARRQADTAEKAFATTTRAWLKLTISGVADRSDSPTATISFTPTYKNLGHTPAKNISFFWQIFVIGVPGSFLPSFTTEPCEVNKSHPSYSGEVLFPQADGGGSQQSVLNWIDLDELRRQGAKVHEIQPSSTVYLGIISCLTYESVGEKGVHFTRLGGDLHLADQQRSGKKGEQKYVPLYDALTQGGTPMKFQIMVTNIHISTD